MTKSGGSVSAGGTDTNSQAPLIAAFRDGLGLVAIVAARDAAGIRIIVDGADATDAAAMDDALTGRWWCRRRIDAERIAAGVTARLRRTPRDAAPASDQSARAAEAVAAAAERLAVALWSDDDVAREAAAVIGKVEAEFARLQAAGEMRAINKSYREERLFAAARGDKVPPYAQWINAYRQNLVRRLAATLRYS